MSVIDQELRPVETVREEIRDLQSYLVGLPEELRASGSFLAYQERLGALDQELALARIAELASSISRDAARCAPTTSHVRETEAHVAHILEATQRQYADLAAANARTSRWLSYTVLASCGATLAGAFGSLLGIVIPAAGLATLAAAVMAFVRPSDRSRQDAELADYLVALRNEVVHFRDLSKRDAVPTSARVEELIARVHALKMAGRSALGARSPRADASKRAG